VKPESCVGKTNLISNQNFVNPGPFYDVARLDWVAWRTIAPNAPLAPVVVMVYLVSISHGVADLPATPEPAARKSVTLPESMWKAIGEYRFYNRIPAEAEAIRQLIQRGLDLARYLEANRATIEILTGRVKHYPGPFSAASSSFDLMDALAGELLKYDPSLRPNEAAKRAEDIYRRAAEEAGADGDRTRSLLNADWRRYIA
jgi:hypothetical protein